MNKFKGVSYWRDRSVWLVFVAYLLFLKKEKEIVEPHKVVEETVEANDKEEQYEEQKKEPMNFFKGKEEFGRII